LQITFVYILRIHKPRHCFAIQKLITTVYSTEESSHY